MLWGAVFQYRVTTLFSLCRSSLSKLMKSRAGELEVNMLLYAIQKTTSFEKLLAQRYINSKYMAEVCIEIGLFLVQIWEWEC